MRHAEDFRCRNREGLGGYFRSGCSGKASLWRLHLSRENNEWKAKTQGKEQGCVFQQPKTAGEHRVGGRGQVQAGRQVSADFLGKAWGAWILSVKGSHWEV